MYPKTGFIDETTFRVEVDTEWRTRTTIFTVKSFEPLRRERFTPLFRPSNLKANIYDAISKFPMIEGLQIVVTMPDGKDKFWIIYLELLDANVPNVATPDFDILLLSGERGEVIANRETRFGIHLNKGIFAESELSYSLEISPDYAVNFKKVFVDESVGQVLIKADALRGNESYLLGLTITNTTLVGSKYFSNSSTEYFSFTTSSPPNGGSFIVNPTTGYENRTPFTIVLSGWKSNYYPLRFEIDGISIDGMQNQHVELLKEGRISNEFEVFSIETQLAGFHYLKATVTDINGEQTEIIGEVNLIEKPQTWWELIQDALKLNPLSTVFYRLNELATEYEKQAFDNANGLMNVPTDVTLADAYEYNIFVLDQLMSYFEVPEGTPQGRQLRSVGAISELVDTIVTF